jgi:hypothetical protein
MARDDTSYLVALNSGAPPSADYVLELAEAIAEAVRVLNHQTHHREALPAPSDANDAIRALALAASRLPQLFGQIGARLEGARPDEAVVSAQRALAEARVHAERLESALKAAAREARRMRASGPAEDD